MIKLIHIKDLFNLYSYDIDLNPSENSRIHFITSPNGYGKTTILSMLNALLSKEYQLLFNIPFSSFRVEFTDNREIEIVRTVVEKETSVDSDIEKDPDIELSISLWNIANKDRLLIENHKQVKKDFSKNSYSTDLLCDSVSDNLLSYGQEANIDMYMASKTSYYLTDSRLLKIKSDVDSEEHHLDAINLEVFAEQMTGILSNPDLYEKYKSEIELFKNLIDNCDFASKELEITKLFGFRFVAKDKLKTKLSLNELSSGEKHLIIQFFKLLFNAKFNTLVLIDEPELSLHMMWQMKYLENLNKIASLRGYQCIVATHSPQIFNSMWSLTTDLYTNSTTD